VRPAFRGLGLGVRLTRAAITAARAAGHRALRLDTLPSMREAHSLYARLGFREIPRYRRDPAPEPLRYFELDFDRA
jgi:ribosomal protein S18 acetylase RimI-like enzyme